MTPRFDIVEAKRWHCGIIARRLRRDHMEVIERSSVSAHTELRYCFDQSAFRKAWLMDGQLVGLGGVMGTLASPSGLIWLALTQDVTKYPSAIVKEAKRQLDYLMQTHRELMTTVVFGDEAARRLAIFLGFHVTHEGIGSSAYSKKSRRLLSQFVENHEERIITVGNVRAVLMGYHALEDA